MFADEQRRPPPFARAHEAHGERRAPDRVLRVARGERCGDSPIARIRRIFASMIVGTGFDLVAVERFARFIARRGNAGLARLFTPSEISYCMSHANPTPFLAVRFAAKEAFYKAVGTGIGAGIGAGVGAAVGGVLGAAAGTGVGALAGALAGTYTGLEHTSEEHTAPLDRRPAGIVVAVAPPGDIGDEKVVQILRENEPLTLEEVVLAHLGRPRGVGYVLGECDDVQASSFE